MQHSTFTVEQKRGIGNLISLDTLEKYVTIWLKRLYFRWYFEELVSGHGLSALLLLHVVYIPLVGLVWLEINENNSHQKIYNIFGRNPGNRGLIEPTFWIFSGGNFFLILINLPWSLSTSLIRIELAQTSSSIISYCLQFRWRITNKYNFLNRIWSKKSTKSELTYFSFIQNCTINNIAVLIFITIQIWKRWIENNGCSLNYNKKISICK